MVFKDNWRDDDFTWLDDDYDDSRELGDNNETFGPTLRGLHRHVKLAYEGMWPRIQWRHYDQVITITITRETLDVIATKLSQ